MARGGHRLPGDAVDLVEGVWPQQPVVSGADEQLQGERLALHVAVELRVDKKRKHAVVVKPSCPFKTNPLSYSTVKINAGLSEVRPSV